VAHAVTLCCNASRKVAGSRRDDFFKSSKTSCPRKLFPDIRVRPVRRADITIVGAELAVKGVVSYGRMV
jgi:hypothetical protein